MKKLDLDYLKKNPNTKCFAVISGYSKDISPVEIGFIFDKAVINLPKKLLELDFSKSYLSDMPDFIIVELTKDHELHFHNTIIGKIVMDVKIQIWAITCDVTLGSNKRSLYEKTFSSKEDADLFINKTLDKRFNPRSFLVEEYDAED